MNLSPWATGNKLVHLDLKGAPPRIKYLQELIPLFARLGADGLLLEYEDMFPFEGELKVLQATDHPPYSREEIQSILDAAKRSGLEVIPLVQTFGHMEFVLKHDEFRELREVGYCLGTLNPHKERSWKLVLEMVRQILELHPGIRHLHIGADEVYLLGQGEESRHWLSIPGHSTHHLFLSHVKRVAKAILESWPQLGLIMWDDMLRGMDNDVLKDSDLAKLVQPMLWDYSPSLDVEETVRLLEKYRSVGLSRVWAASSFKGSTSVYTCVTGTERHVENHLRWLEVMAALPSGVEMQGIAITGWQRYDHLSTLCELLPVGLPSLASCLQTLRHGCFGLEARTGVAETLGISVVEVADMASSSSGGAASYPGQRLAELVVELTTLLQSEEIRLDDNMYVKGWFTPYHRKRKIVNPLIVQQIQQQAMALLASVDPKVCVVRREMARLFPDSTAEEWMQQHVGGVLEPVRGLLRDTHAVVRDETQPHSPRLPPAGQEG